MSRTRSSTISPASSRNWRVSRLQIQQQKIEYISVIGSVIGSSMCPEFITAPINISNAVNFADRSPALYPTSICIKRSRTISFKFSSFAIRAINDCLTSIDNRRRLTWLCFSSDSMMKLSQRCSRKKLFSRIELNGLRYEITLRLNIKMYCFS